MKNTHEQNGRAAIAVGKVAKLKHFYLHLGAYVSLNLVLLIFWKTTVFIAAPEFWETTFFVTGAIGGLGLLAHWAFVFGYRLFLGKGWEAKKIQKLIDNKEIK